MAVVRKYKSYLVLALVLVAVVWPLLSAGFFRSDDGTWMIIRLSAFHQTLATGQFPVRFLERLNHNYGYPVVNFLYPLPFYLGEIVHLLGAGFVEAVKILFGASFVLGSLVMFWWVRGKWGEKAGLVAGIFYTLSPYRLFDVYKRGALGEAVAFIFVPLVFYFLDKRVREKTVSSLILAGFSLAAVITSHNSLAVMFLPVVIAYSLSSRWRLTELLVVFGLGLLTSAFFWLPAIYDLQFTQAVEVTVANFKDHFLFWDELVWLVSPLGVLAVGVSILRRRETGKEAAVMVAAIILALFLSSAVSSFVWEATVLPMVVQFPWRFLAVTPFCTAVLVAFLARELSGKGVLALGGLLLVLAIPFLKVEREFYPESFYTTNEDTTTVANEYLSRWFRGKVTNRPKSRIEVVAGEATIGEEDEVFAKTAAVVRVNTMYFPGHRVYVNGKQHDFRFGEDLGVVELTVLPGRLEVEVRFEETPVRMGANLVTAGALVVASAFLWRQRGGKSGG